MLLWLFLIFRITVKGEILTRNIFFIYGAHGRHMVIEMFCNYSYYGWSYCNTCTTLLDKRDIGKKQHTIPFFLRSFFFHSGSLLNFHHCATHPLSFCETVGLASFWKRPCIGTGWSITIWIRSRTSNANDRCSSIMHSGFTNTAASHVTSVCDAVRWYRSERCYFQAWLLNWSAIKGC